MRSGLLPTLGIAVPASSSIERGAAQATAAEAIGSLGCRERISILNEGHGR